MEARDSRAHRQCDDESSCMRQTPKAHMGTDPPQRGAPPAGREARLGYWSRVLSILRHLKRLEITVVV